MKKILTSSEMKKYDAYTINEIGIPSMVLMERAAISVYEEVVKYADDTNRKPEHIKVLVVCGTGNNGGDGLAVARLLSQKGFFVKVVLYGDREKLSHECRQQYEILQRLNLGISTQTDEVEYDIIIDSLFGIGLSRPLGGGYAALICDLNQRNAYKIAVDIPSGLCADTGRVLGVSFKADLTVTFGFCKRGLLVGDGMLYAGQILCKDIGIYDCGLQQSGTDAWVLDEEIKELLPVRKPNGNKGTFGKVFIYAGSEETFGAALLCAKSALSAGAGMIKVLCPAKLKDFMLHEIPEAMLLCYGNETPQEELESEIMDALLWCDSVVAGPGIGINKFSSFLLQILLKYAKVPMVLDADALNLLSSDDELKQLLLYTNKKNNRELVITPHLGEMSRLLNCSVGKLKEEPFEMARKLSKSYDAIAVCKDARTILCQDEKDFYINTSGNHGMATAGSGDVLAGILGAYSAISDDVYKDAAIAVCLHGKAGDVAADMVGMRALTASHMIEGMIALQKGI